MKFYQKLMVLLLLSASTLFLDWRACANPRLVLDVDSGAVLKQQDATQLWYPASVTKLMTVYAALKAVRENKITIDTPLIVSPRAARMAPSKMGFKPGTEITLGNALKILMVKSANDVAVTVAEGTSGSVEAFADEMNTDAEALGMNESHFVNPNGLPDPGHYSSARDLAILGRALYLDFPDYSDLFDIGALQLGSHIMVNHNGLLGRYPGLDGMKTGFTCAAGFNIVVSAQQNSKHFIVVVLGANSVKDRSTQVVNLLNQAFSGTLPISDNVASLPRLEPNMPPDMHRSACGRHRVSEEISDDSELVSTPLASMSDELQKHPERALLFEASGLGISQPASPSILLAPKPNFTPQIIYIGRAPGWVGSARGPVNLAKASPDQTIEAFIAKTTFKSSNVLKGDNGHPALHLAGAQSLKRTVRKKGRTKASHSKITASELESSKLPQAITLSTTNKPINSTR